MKSLAKKLTLILVVVLSLALCVAFVACNDKGGEKPNGVEGKYKVQVLYEDGTPVTGIKVQLCVLDENGELVTCLTPQAVDENGVSLQENAAAFPDTDTMEIHFEGLPAGSKIKLANGTYATTEDYHDIFKNPPVRHLTVKLGWAVTVYIAPPATTAAAYTATVQNPDETPATGVSVSFAEVVDSATLSPVAVLTDSEGRAAYTSQSGNSVDVSFSNIPSGLKVPDAQQTIRLTPESNSVTVKLERVSDVSDELPDLEYSAPMSGSGTARYASEQQIESYTFDPYVIGEGNYELMFETSSQRIYLEFRSGNSQPALYRIYSRGGTDASVQIITGSPISALFNPGKSATDNDGRAQFNDNSSASDKNFELEFSNNESVTMGYSTNGVFYFELALEDPSHTGRRFAVTVEKLDKPYVPKPPTQYTEVHASPAPQKAEEGKGALHTIPANAGNFKVVRAEDGTYRLGGESGPVLYANLDGPWPFGADLMSGQPMTCILRLSGGSNPYRWIKSLSNVEGDKGEDWLPFLCEHVGYIVDTDGTPVAPGGTNSATGTKNNGVSKCNSDGYYPVNDQIVEFLTNVYNDDDVQWLYFKPENLLNINWILPEGYEWLFLTGYYGEEYKGESFGGSGTEQDPYTLSRQGAFDLAIPAGGRLYFSAGLSYSISSPTAGAMASFDGAEYGADGNGFELEYVPSESGERKLLSVYMKSGEAGTISIVVRLAMQGKGTLDEPYSPSSPIGAYVEAGGECWYDIAFAAGEGYGITADRAGVTVKLYTLDGYLALLGGEDVEPEMTWTSADGSLSATLDVEGECILVVSSADGSGFTWEITAA